MSVTIVPPEDIVVKEEHDVPSESEEVMDTVDLLEYKKEIKMEITKQELSTAGGRRRSRRLQNDPQKINKKLSTCVREERQEAYRQKCKRKYERKKQRIANMSEEERAILREKARISHLKRRQKLREQGYVPKRQSKHSKRTVPPKTQPELSEEEKKRRKQELSMKHKFNNLVKVTLMSDEERERQRLKRYLQAHAWKASKSKEEMEAMKAKHKERLKQRIQEDEEYRQHISQRNRNWRQNLTEEKRKRYMGSVKKAVTKYLKNLKVKNPEMYNKNYEKLKAKLRKKTASETPEQRQKRLQRYKINAARTKLKKQLEKEGAAPEVVQAKIDELVEKMKREPLPPPSEYKPRPRKSGGRKGGGGGAEKKTEKEISLIEEEDVEGEQGEFAGDDGGGGGSISYTFHFAPCITINTLVEGQGEIPNVELESSIIIPVVDPSLLVGSQEPSIISIPTIATLEEFTHDDNNDDFSPPPASPLPEPLEDKQQFPPTSQPSPPLPSPPPSSLSTPFKCPHCPQVLDSDPALRNHLKTFHLHACWKCPKCYQVMLSPAELPEHFKSHHNSIEQQKQSTSRGESEVDKKSCGKFICMKCPYISERQRNNRFDTLASLSGHVRRKHPKSYWPCPSCKILKYSKDRLQFHRKSCSIKL